MLGTLPLSYSKTTFITTWNYTSTKFPCLNFASNCHRVKQRHLDVAQKKQTFHFEARPEQLQVFHKEEHREDELHNSSYSATATN